MHAFIEGSTSWMGQTRLGTVQLLRGQLDEARRAFDAALVTKPDHEEARLGKVECLLEAGDAAQALATAEPLLGPRPDAWVLAAAAAEQLGALDVMGSFLARAKQALDTGYVAPHRADRYLGLLCALSIYKGQPIATRTRLGVLSALVARAPMVRGTRRVFPSDVRLVRTLVRNLHALGRVELLQPLLEPRAELHLPGVTAHMVQCCAEVGIALSDQPPTPAASP
jgi:tetratricopeptide (TPR) repeat protein